MTFWVYENIVVKKTRLHRGDCSFCNFGRGFHSVEKTVTGSWHGPFGKLLDATRFATSRGHLDQRSCTHCLSGQGATRSKTIDRKSSPESAHINVHSKSLDESVLESLEAQLHLKWASIGLVGLDAKGKLSFPGASEAPGIYRFRARRADGTLSCYVGESENINRRFGHYRNPGPTQQTNMRLNAHFTELLAGGGAISVAIAVGCSAASGSQGLTVDLAEKSWRRLFECFAMIMDGSSEIERLNR